MVLGLAAAVAYCSWPLGYLLNRALVDSSLASDLEAPGQPYNWLFITLDCVTGVAVIAAAVLLWRAGRDRSVGLPLASYVLFGLATGVDALIPVGCGSKPINSCGVDLNHLNADDYLTGFAIFALFVSVSTAHRWAVRTVSWNPLLLTTTAAVVAWGVCGLVFLAIHFQVRPAVATQHVMLTLTSVVTFIVPLVIWRTGARRERSASR
jgi:hypothetical protein